MLSAPPDRLPAEYMLGSYYGFAAGSILTPYRAIAERVEAHNRQRALQRGSLAAGAAEGVELEMLTGAEVMGTGQQAGGRHSCRWLQDVGMREGL